ncbi:LysR substrate-binding domain-containing protein [Desulfogranum mediterraneum]|uniref:LysR substrate-binding domain-containing protein n=1 Tax=Desulfogranum mediterraneum TaxID=160661 RepID=UPI0003F58365|nr:LysR substrate-binding domain-containing protein [Desulfogranum mediterraneum]
MDLPSDLLRTFVAAADAKSYSRAAEIIHRSQSAVSMQMKRLEETVDCKLFKRSGHTMKLTRQGHTLLWYARRLLKLQEEAVAAMVQPELSGRVRLGAPETYAERQLPQILSRFAQTYPHVEVELACSPSQALLQALDDSELDLLIQTNGEVPGRGETIGHEQVVWAASKKHCVHEQDPVPIAVYYEACIWRDWAVKSLEGAGRSYRIACTSPSVSGLLAAAKGGLAVTVVGESCLSDDLFVLGPADGFPELPRSTVTLVQARHPLSQAAASLACYVTESFREMTES